MRAVFVSPSDVRSHRRLRGDSFIYLRCRPNRSRRFSGSRKVFPKHGFRRARLLNADSNLRIKIDRTHQVQLANGLDMVEADLNEGCGAGSSGTIWYPMPPAG